VTPTVKVKPMAKPMGLNSQMVRLMGLNSQMVRLMVKVKPTGLRWATMTPTGWPMGCQRNEPPRPRRTAPPLPTGWGWRWG